MGPNKYIHLAFAVAICWPRFSLKTGDWIWSYFAKPNEPAAAGFGLGGSCGGWPVGLSQRTNLHGRRGRDPGAGEGRLAHRKETYYATIVVIVTVFISRSSCRHSTPFGRSGRQGYQ